MAIKFTEFKEAEGVPSAIEMEIKGAAFLTETTESVVIRLKGVDVVELPWAEVEGVLQRAGVGDADRMYLVESFAQLTEQHLLAKALAKRLRRVG